MRASTSTGPRRADSSGLERARRRAWLRARSEPTVVDEKKIDELQKTAPVNNQQTKAESSSSATLKPAVDESAVVTTLEELPDDILFVVARCVLSFDTRAAARLCQANKLFGDRLQEIWAMAHARRIRWLPEMTELHEIGNDDRTLIAAGPVDEDLLTLQTVDVEYMDGRGNTGFNSGTRSWAVGGLLPSTGRTEWTVRIDQSANGRMLLGVCEESGAFGWGLEPYDGRLHRYWRNGNGDVDLERTRPPYNGYPDGDGNRLMAGVLRGTAEASVVEISVDADAGTVGFTVDEGGTSRGLPKSHVAHPRRYELGGFPRGVAPRPWAMLYLHLGDQVTLGGCGGASK